MWSSRAALEGRHQLLEILLAADLAQVGGREVAVHAGAVPVGVAQRLAVVLDVDAVLLGQAGQQVARHPHLVGGPLRALAEDLELPLALRHLGVDALVVDAGGEADVEMLLDDPAARRRRPGCSPRPCSRGPAGAGIAACRGSPAGGRPCRGNTPARSRTRRPRRRGWWRACSIGCGVSPSGIITSHSTSTPLVRSAVREDAHRLQHAVRAPAFRLLGGAAVEAPQGQLLQRRERRSNVLDLRLAAQVGDGGVPVEPDILELILRHCRPLAN